jgi:endonuclease YncB( thermonuclease family)
MHRCLWLAASAFLAVAPARAADLSGPTRVIDGETLEIGGTTLLLYGVDVPGRGQACTREGRLYDCWQEAGWALAERVGRHWLRCLARGHDPSGRARATCHMGNDIDVGAHMVRHGWALARRHEEPAYGALEDLAKRERLGLWAGTFEPPPQRP